MSLFNYIYTSFKLFNLKYKGKNIVVRSGGIFYGNRNIIIGDFCYFGPNCRVEAWEEYLGVKYYPEIIIGRDVRINSKCHIGAINKIIIGDDCLFGSNVMIHDHSHGRSTYEDSEKHPSNRDLYSKGPIVIGKRCWLGENVVVLPNVKIGDCCIIGANSVVTHDIPAYSVAVGNPARVVKQYCK